MTNDIMYIYALVDPRDDKTRYVGVTGNLVQRFRTHLRLNQSAKRHGGKRYDWIAELRDNGLFPKMFILEESNWNEWEDAERRWILYMREIGNELLNVNNGGAGPKSISDETREKLRTSHLGIRTRPMPESLKKIIIARLRKLTQVQVEEIRVLLATRDDLNTIEIGKMYNVCSETINDIAYHNNYSEFTEDDGLQSAIDSKKRRYAHSKGGHNSIPDDTVRLIRQLAEGGMMMTNISKEVNVNYANVANIVGRKTYKLVK